MREEHKRQLIEELRNFDCDKYDEECTGCPKLKYNKRADTWDCYLLDDKPKDVSDHDWIDILFEAGDMGLTKPWKRSASPVYKAYKIACRIRDGKSDISEIESVVGYLGEFLRGDNND